MRFTLALLLTLPISIRGALQDEIDGLLNQVDPTTYGRACPDYTHYARGRHHPFSAGPLALPFQRPSKKCRTFHSDAVETVIEDITSRMTDSDLAQIFRNAFPNTIDTTVRWHVDGIKTFAPQSNFRKEADRWHGAQSFIVTGDINAEWLRDSTNQLAQYQSLATTDPALSVLILGAINTQAEFVISSPYCNAFQPPGPSKLRPTHAGQEDIVHPAYEPSQVFECKYELDSLAAFLALSNQYYANTGKTDFVTQRWYRAIESVFNVLDTQGKGTFDRSGIFRGAEYTFRRHAWSGTETLGLSGVGNPLNNGTGLIRSAFRPSDDATIFGFLIPANAMMSVELARTAEMLRSASPNSAVKDLATNLQNRAEKIRAGIYEHGIVKHKVWGEVFAYEVDGYGSSLLMDDANIPSLLSLPLLGFVNASDPIYQNTRKMVLSQRGNPYYLSGPEFHGIGGPHIGLRNAWPMSLLVQAMTSTDKHEIMNCISAVKNISGYGLINESVDVEAGLAAMTRSWFAWANSVFAQTILHIAERSPELLFGNGAKAYKIGEGFVDG